MPEAPSRTLIPHLDDVGMCHGANRACLELLGAGFVTTASVMVPCPWFPEIAAAARATPSLDLGVHLTLTSEWPGYRWRPISTASRASGLLDADGFMWPDVPSLRAHLDVAAAEAELRAQIEGALEAGIDATHLDTHMGAAATPELLAVYLGLGRAYRLPILLPRDIESYLGVLAVGDRDGAAYDAALAELERAGVPIIDRFRITPCAPPATSDAVYRRLIRDLPPGTTFLSLHCNAPGDIEAISPEWAVWRTDEYRLCGERAFHDFVRAEGVALAGFRELREAYRARLVTEPA